MAFPALPVSDNLRASNPVRCTPSHSPNESPNRRNLPVHSHSPSPSHSSLRTSNTNHEGTVTTPATSTPAFAPQVVSSPETADGNADTAANDSVSLALPLDTSKHLRPSLGARELTFDTFMFTDTTLPAPPPSFQHRAHMQPRPRIRAPPPPSLDLPGQSTLAPAVELTQRPAPRAPGATDPANYPGSLAADRRSVIAVVLTPSRPSNDERPPTSSEDSDTESVPFLGYGYQ